MTKARPVWENLRQLAFKLKAVGYLVEDQTFGDALPADLSDLHYGLSLILLEMSQGVLSASRSLEVTEMKAERETNR